MHTFPHTACKDKKVEVELDDVNLNSASNPDTVSNLIYGVGSPKDTWSPVEDDPDKALEINLPEVNGVPAGQYDIMEVKIKPTGNLGPVTVKIFDAAGNKVFDVSDIFKIKF